MSDKKREQILAEGREVIALEAASLKSLATRLDDSFVDAVLKIVNNKGRLVTLGMGKAGHIAMKVAASLASTGTPAFFIHPAEAMHGDLGMVIRGDMALFFSHSGETEELCRLLPYLKARQVGTIAITASRDSTLAQGSDIVLELGEIKEACSLSLAPSSSSTCMLALGDALASAVLETRGFTESDFARLHPGGTLGLSLSTAGEMMRSGDRCPLIPADTKVRKAVEAISEARSGCACVVDGRDHLLGVFTDGDFRRAWAHDDKLGDRLVSEVMTSPGISLPMSTLVREARSLMNKHHINALPVLNEAGKVVGLLDIQDI